MPIYRLRKQIEDALFMGYCWLCLVPVEYSTGQYGIPIPVFSENLKSGLAKIEFRSFKICKIY
jgi:hypothetical protein